MEKKLYDRRPAESARAYAAFKAYCDLGPDRSIRKAVRKLGKNKTTLEQWSKRWEWVERSVAWDADAEARAREANDAAMKIESEKWAKRQLAMRDEAFELGDELIKKAKAMLNFPISKQTVQQDGKTIIINPTKFSLGSAARMIEVGEKLRRLAVGIPTDKVEHVGQDNTPLPTATGQIVILELPPGRLAEDGKANE